MPTNGQIKVNDGTQIAPIADIGLQRAGLLSAISAIRPPLGDIAVIPMGDRTYVRAGSIDGFVRVLPQDDDFSSFTFFKNSRGVRVPAGTHVAAIKDVKPFDSLSRSDEPYIRNLAKIQMTGDMLEFVAKAEEIDPEVQTFYVLTNPPMARFMCDHWGFHILGEEDTQVSKDLQRAEESFVIYADKPDIEEAYPHLADYLPELVRRNQELEEKAGLNPESGS